MARVSAPVLANLLRRLGWRVAAVLARAVAAVALLVALVMDVGGYYDPLILHYAPGAAGVPAPRGLVAVYVSSDMGLNLGAGEGAIVALHQGGVPVEMINSSAAFACERDVDFATRLMAQAMRHALARSGATRIALVGTSFGADMITASFARLPAALRARVASVALIIPGTDIHFQANPTGLSYQGPGELDSVRAAHAFAGVPVTCIHGSAEDDSLCVTPALRGARQIALPDGHLMLGHYREVAAGAAAAVLAPPPPMALAALVTGAAGGSM